MNSKVKTHFKIGTLSVLFRIYKRTYLHDFLLRVWTKKNYMQ